LEIRLLLPASLKEHKEEPHADKRD
jgi:hypothetical protein